MKTSVTCEVSYWCVIHTNMQILMGQCKFSPLRVIEWNDTEWNILNLLDHAGKVNKQTSSGQRFELRLYLLEGGFNRSSRAGGFCWMASREAWPLVNEETLQSLRSSRMASMRNKLSKESSTEKICRAKLGRWIWTGVMSSSCTGCWLKEKPDSCLAAKLRALFIARVGALKDRIPLPTGISDYAYG